MPDQETLEEIIRRIVDVARPEKPSRLAPPPEECGSRRPSACAVREAASGSRTVEIWFASCALVSCGTPFRDFEAAGCTLAEEFITGYITGNMMEVIREQAFSKARH